MQLLYAAALAVYIAMSDWWENALYIFTGRLLSVRVVLEN